MYPVKDIAAIMDSMADTKGVTIEDLNKLNAAYGALYNRCKSEMTARVKSQIAEGARVTWVSNRGGGRLEGMVTKVKRTKAIVRTDRGVSWDVPIVMLSVIYPTSDLD